MIKLVPNYKMNSILKLILVLVIYGVQCIAVSHASLDGEWKIYSAGSDAAMLYGKDYVKKYSDDLEKIYIFADALHKDGRFSEVVNVYSSALKYFPKRKDLYYKFNLARSNLEEINSLNSFNLQQYKKFGHVNSAKLDEIKCKTLRSEEADRACKRIGLDKPMLAIADKPIINNDSTVSRVDIPVTRTSETVDDKKAKNSTNRVKAEIDVGEFHALVIGNNDYPNFPKLETAVNDANAVADILKQDYGFKVTRLKNANRYKIFEQLSYLRNKLGENDNLLIYYAGHGYLDEDTQRGYWLPIDAEEDNYANWLSTNDITDMLNGMSSKHVLVVADSCYSGTLTRNVNPLRTVDVEQIKWLQRILEKRSRTVMTSGGLEPVLDSGGGEHSIFTNAFINALIENENILEASRMFASVKRSVVLNADQTPEYADIRKAGHEGGDFIFIRTN